MWINALNPSFFFFFCSADGVSKGLAALDDSVSEEDEEEGSFDELADVTPYLEPGVELSVLVEVSSPSLSF